MKCMLTAAAAIGTPHLDTLPVAELLAVDHTAAAEGTARKAVGMAAVMHSVGEVREVGCKVTAVVEGRDSWAVEVRPVLGRLVLHLPGEKTCSWSFGCAFWTMEKE